jgi:pantoate--beta-alanine ligase
MNTLTTIKQLRCALDHERQQGKTIAFVPTMGNLHDGHLSLVREAQQRADIVVVSIFVNPLQFGANEDLDSYPRTIAADKEKLFAERTHYLFLPSVAEMYPNGMAEQTLVEVPDLSATLCGASRPGHFTGVATVVTKLFQMVQPHIAIFGKKDFQQLAIIKKLTQDLCMPIEVIGLDTARAADGLALSSRNGYLSEQQRTIAPRLQQILSGCRDAIGNGDSDYQALRQQAIEVLESAGFSTDYFEICDAYTLQPASPDSAELVIAAAAKLGSTRLIDNLTLSVNPKQDCGLAAQR